MNKTEIFIRRARAVHGGVYDYSKVAYKRAVEKVVITCKRHGDFLQSPHDHLKGSGCKRCGVEKRSQLAKFKAAKEFSRKAHAVHAEFYSYHKVEYINAKTPVIIVCPVHGDFKQVPNYHLSGNGCPKCAIGKIARGTKLLGAELLQRIPQKIRDMYNIDEIPDTIGRLDKINLVCPTHGSFTITVRSLMKGQGCTKCGWARGAAKNRHTLEDFVTAAKAAHGNTYEYNNVEYVNSSAKVAITCRTHGDFYMTPASHVSDRQGCPKCAHTGPSKQEQSVCEFLDGLGIDYLQTDRRVIKPKELDIVIPSKNIAIEYNGLRWHSTQFLRDNTYHRNKSRLCEAAGYRLIHIWEDDWIFRQEHIKNMLTGALCNIRAVYGRHTKLREIDRITAEAFMVKNHIQGATNSTERYGLFHNGELVSVATFLRNRSWYLNRCATKHGLRVIGSLGKFTKNFVKRHRGEQLISFCDISMYSGQSYLSAGFTVDSILPPDYKYVVNNQRIHKFNFRRKHLRKFLGSRFEPSLSEVQNMERAGYYRVFDCGKIRFVLK